MSNYQVGNPAPEAFITKNKQRVKQFNGTVYLKDGDNFEIELFNPKSNKVLAKIYLDGKLISSSGIIIKPGQRVHLERYIDSNHKFLYSTYVVNGENQQVQDAIKSNGDLEVKFYDEYIPSTYTSGTVYYDATTYAPIYGTNTTSAPDFGTTFYCNSSSDTLGTPISANSYEGPNIRRKGAGTRRQVKAKKAKKVETGTVEKGETSKQEFQYSSDSFNSYTTNTTTWKILPLSQKPVSVGEIKVFCVNCGTRKRKQSHQFCPNCGTKFE